MFVHVPIIQMVQVPIVKVVGVATVLYGCVTTIWAMLVAMSP